jgi:hypothetical protein
MDPSRLMGRGRKGKAFERSFLSTIESQRRSGISLREVVALLELWGAKAAAEPARRVAMASFIFKAMYVED